MSMSLDKAEVDMPNTMGSEVSKCHQPTQQPETHRKFFFDFHLPLILMLASLMDSWSLSVSSRRIRELGM